MTEFAMGGYFNEGENRVGPGVLGVFAAGWRRLLDVEVTERWPGLDLSSFCLG
jgi:hypothetical protein